MFTAVYASCHSNNGVTAFDYACIFQMSEPISTIIGKFQRDFVLKTSANCTFITFITQSGSTT